VDEGVVARGDCRIVVPPRFAVPLRAAALLVRANGRSRGRLLASRMPGVHRPARGCRRSGGATGLAAVGRLSERHRALQHVPVVAFVVVSVACPRRDCQLQICAGQAGRLGRVQALLRYNEEKSR
jgi:hypothetical protein